MFKRVGKMIGKFLPLNTHREHICCKVLHLHNIHILPTPKEDAMAHKPGRWCKFYRVKRHHIEDCYQLYKEINRLIQEGHLRKYVKGDYSHGSDKSNS